MPQGRFCIL